MNIENIATTLRPRSGWQSIDLGFMLGRKWFLPLFLLWCMLSLPVYLVCKLAGLPGWLVIFAWWWFKPLYEAPLYFWCSRAVFSEKVTLRQSLSVLPRKLLSLFSTYLFLWRPGTARSQNMSVMMIENLKRKDRSARISTISRVTTRTSPLLFVCIHIEVALAYSMILIGYAMLPNSVTEDALLLTMIGQADSFWLVTSMEICTLLAAGIVAPFYVCAGFSLYINRRTHLEAWDIDLHFRQLLQRHGSRRQFDRVTSVTDQEGQETSFDTQDRAPPSVAASILGISFILCCLLQPAADAVANTVPDDRHSHQLINEILEHDDFGVMTTTKKLQFIEREETVDDSDWFNWNIEWNWLEAIVEFFRSVSSVALWIEGLLWVLAAVIFGAVAYLIIANSRHMSGIRGHFGFNRRVASQVQVFDLDIAPKSLPADIPSAAKDLLSAGQNREAMSLLYRGALSRLVHRYGMEITESATERQCVELVNLGQPAERSNVFTLLTRSWLEVAYGRHGVSDDQVSTLCEQWPRAFDVSSGSRGVVVS